MSEYKRFKFLSGFQTLEEYLTEWGYESMDELCGVCSACDREDWYEWVVKEFKYKKDEEEF